MRASLLCAAAGLMAALSSCTITMPLAVSSNPVGAKIGTSQADIFLGFLCFGGDYSIKTAAKNGGITRISTVDVKVFNVLGVYEQRTCIISGE